nr:adenylyl-sulfate kinase [Actinomycetota bacterium]
MTSVTAEPAAVPQLCPATTTLDDLDLLRSGALGEGVTVGPESLVRIDLPEQLGKTSDRSGTRLEVVDPEGVPLAGIPLVPSEGGGSVPQGEPRWLSRRSDRPFERFHRGPSGLPGGRTTVVLDHVVSPELLRRSIDPVTGALRLLVLASTDAEDSTQGLAVARLARHLQRDRPGVDLVIAPLGPTASHRAEKKARVITAYAGGGPVVDLTSSSDRPGGAAPVPAGEQGVVILFTGLSGSGKSTIARAVRNHLLEETERTVTMLDGDLVRRHLSRGLTFSVQDRDTNVRRIGWVAAEIAHHGGIAIASPIAPIEATRRDVRALVQGRGGR